MRCSFLRKTTLKTKVKELEKALQQAKYDLEIEKEWHAANVSQLQSENNRLKEKLARYDFSIHKPTPNWLRKYAIYQAVRYIDLNATPAITFEVDKEARKVTAIMQSDKHGIGKIRSHLLCRDDQVFNEHIFKAATLANLLQDHIAAEKFANAVQPNFTIGQIVTLTLPNWGWERFEITAYDKDGRWKLNNLLEDEQGHETEENLTILDDTNAKY